LKSTLLMAFVAVAFSFDAKTGERQAFVTLGSNDTIAEGVAEALGRPKGTPTLTMTFLTDEHTAAEIQRKGEYVVSLNALSDLEDEKSKINTKLAEVMAKSEPTTPGSVDKEGDLSIGTDTKGDTEGMAEILNKDPGAASGLGVTNPISQDVSEKVAKVGSLKIGS
jgi:hypothetical protein